MDPALNIVIVDENPVRAAILIDGLREAGYTRVTRIEETTNLLERFHKEIRRKQRDIGMFQSEQGCETLWYLLSRRETAKQRAILQSRS